MCKKKVFSFLFLPLGIFDLTASFLNESTMVVRWRSTLKNVSGYNVVILNESGELRRQATGNTSFVKIGSLEQCRNYTVKVAANSSLGIGNYSSLQYLTRCGKSITAFYSS